MFTPMLLSYKVVQSINVKLCLVTLKEIERLI